MKNRTATQKLRGWAIWNQMRGYFLAGIETPWALCDTKKEAIRDECGPGCYPVRVEVEYRIREIRRSGSL